MKIEEAIQQTKNFKNPLEKALVNIHFTSSWLTHISHEVLSQKDLSIQQYNILRILRGKYPEAVTVKYLIDRMIDKNSNASRLVDKLLKKQFVDRTTCKNDRRRVDIKINSEGLNTLEEMEQKMSLQINKKLNLSETEANELSDLLDKLRTKP